MNGTAKPLFHSSTSKTRKASCVWCLDKIHLSFKHCSVGFSFLQPMPTTDIRTKFESYPKVEPIKLRDSTFLFIYYYFSSLENFEFLWIYPGEEKISVTTDRFHNHTKEMTSSSWEQFLLLSEIWGEKFHFFFHQTTKMDDVILIPQKLILHALSKHVWSPHMFIQHWWSNYM